MFKLSKEFITINALATLQRIEPLGDLFAEFLFAQFHQFVTICQQAQSVPDDFTGRSLAATFDSALDELFQFLGEMYVHGGSLLRA